MLQKAFLSQGKALLTPDTARPMLIASKRCLSSTTTGDDSEETRLRRQLLKASLIHAKTLGFTDASLTAACRDLALPSVSEKYASHYI